MNSLESNSNLEDKDQTKSLKSKTRLFTAHVLRKRFPENLSQDREYYTFGKYWCPFNSYIIDSKIDEPSTPVLYCLGNISEKLPEQWVRAQNVVREARTPIGIMEQTASAINYYSIQV